MKFAVEIPVEKEAAFSEFVEEMHPCPMIQTGEKPEDVEREFSLEDWAMEWLRREIIGQYARYDENRRKKSIKMEPDDDLIRVSKIKR